MFFVEVLKRRRWAERVFDVWLMGNYFLLYIEKGKGKGVGKYIGGNKSGGSSYLDGSAIFRRDVLLVSYWLSDNNHGTADRVRHPRHGQLNKWKKKKKDLVYNPAQKAQ
jgi:hypothetical protein